MTRRRWIADEVNHRRAALVGAHAAHLSRTLRARVGQEFEVACGDRVRRAIIVSLDDERVEFELGEEISISAPRPKFSQPTLRPTPELVGPGWPGTHAFVASRHTFPHE